MTSSNKYANVNLAYRELFAGLESALKLPFHRWKYLAAFLVGVVALCVLRVKPVPDGLLAAGIFGCVWGVTNVLGAMFMAPKGKEGMEVFALMIALFLGTAVGALFSVFQRGYPVPESFLAYTLTACVLVAAYVHEYRKRMRGSSA